MLNDTKTKYSAAEIQRILGVPKNTYYRFKQWANEQSKIPLKIRKERT